MIISCIFENVNLSSIINLKNLVIMTKEEFIEELNSMIDAEMNITNLQSEHFNEDLLKTLWNIKAMAMELEV